MRAHLDNDAILKLSESKAIHASLKILRTGPAEARVLSTSPAVLRRMLQKVEQGIETRFSVDGVTRALEFVQATEKLTQGPDLVEYEELLSIPKIDPGEALLFEGTRGLREFVVVTGDKRALRALAESAAHLEVYDRLRGNVVCFEQVVMRLIATHGFKKVRERMAPTAHCDRALQAVFPDGVETSEESARRRLNNFITQLWEETGLLAPT